MSRDSFVFYKSWLDGIELLSDEEQLQAYRALARYACNGSVPEVTGTAGVIFTIARPVIDSNNEKYEAGRKGGRPKKTSGFENKNQWFTDQKPVVSELKTSGFENENHRLGVNVNDNVNDNADVNVNDNADVNNSPVFSDSVGDDQEPKKPADKIDYKAIIGYLNEKAGKRYKDNTEATRRLIRARIKEGYSVEDFYRVIDNKVQEWTGTKFEPYLRPETLFAASHFDGYLNNSVKKPEYVSGELPF